MVAWTVLWVAVGLYSVPAAVVGPGIDHGSYYESDDHPDPCPDLQPALLYSLTAIAGGSCSLVVAVRVRRQRPGSRAAFVLVVPTWAAVLLAMGMWAAAEDDSTPLSAPGRGFLVLAVVNVTVCLLATVLALRTRIVDRPRLQV